MRLVVYESALVLIAVRIPLKAIAGPGITNPITFIDPSCIINDYSLIIAKAIYVNLFPVNCILVLFYTEVLLILQILVFKQIRNYMILKYD